MVISAFVDQILKFSIGSMIHSLEAKVDVIAICVACFKVALNQHHVCSTLVNRRL